MSPFRRKDRPHWYIAPTLPGFGRVGQWSTDLPLTIANKRVATAMEELLSDLAINRPRIIEHLIGGRFDVADVWVAHKRDKLRQADETGPTHMDQLEQLAQDPLLSEKIDEYLPRVTDARVRDGFAILLQLAPEGARFSYLHDHTHISDMCADAIAAGRKPNSVLRSLYRAISELLNRNLPAGRVAEILKPVKKPKAKDQRNVRLTMDQIVALLDECDEEFRLFVAMAILTGIDRLPLLRALPIDLSGDDVLVVRDSKADARSRQLELSEPAAAAFRLAAAGKDPHELVWTYSESGVSSRFEAARDRAGLSHVRFKDLRHVLATALEGSGASIKDIQLILGHGDAKTTLIYTGSQPSHHRDLMRGAALRMGLDRFHLRIAEEGPRSPRPRRGVVCESRSPVSGRRCMRKDRHGGKHKSTGIGYSEEWEDLPAQDGQLAEGA